MVIKKLIFEQSVKGIRIYKNRIRCSHSRSSFRVLPDPDNNTLRIYGCIPDETVRLSYTGRTVEKFISGSRVRFSPITKTLSENDIPQSRFSSPTRVYHLPVRWSIDLHEIIMRDMCSLREISICARKTITQAGTEPSSLREPLLITLHDSARITAKIDRCTIKAVLYDESLMQCAEKINTPERQSGPARRVASTLYGLTAVLRDKTRLCGISVTEHARISVLSVNAHCSINALGNCTVNQMGPNCVIKRYGARVSPNSSSENIPSPVIATYRGLPREEALALHQRIQQRMRSPLWAEQSAERSSQFEELVLRSVLQRSMEETSMGPSVDHGASFSLSEEQKQQFRTKHFELAGTSTDVHIQKEGARLKPHSCLICMDKPPSVVVVPCGHFVFCGECADTSQFHVDKCPLCKRGISSAVHTRLSDLVEA